ncbi:unnamed protein product [Amoebophrya sp. A25]|nr:unnamed protein product [Amoebophrya sp. A25]|eukprot:GSA25T00015454001.1
MASSSSSVFNRGQPGPGEEAGGGGPARPRAPLRSAHLFDDVAPVHAQNRERERQGGSASNSPNKRRRLNSESRGPVGAAIRQQQNPQASSSSSSNAAGGGQPAHVSIDRHNNNNVLVARNANDSDDDDQDHDRRFFDEVEGDINFDDEEDEDIYSSLEAELEQRQQQPANNVGNDADDPIEATVDLDEGNDFDLRVLGDVENFEEKHGEMHFYGEETAHDAIDRLLGPVPGFRRGNQFADGEEDDDPEAWFRRKLSLPDGLPIRLSKSIFDQLHPHQVRALLWMHALRLQREGGILADDMGMGKTVSVCAFLHSLRRSAPILTQCRHVLILCPRALLGVWEKECGKWCPEFRCISVAENSTSYGSKNVKKRAAEISRNEAGGILLANYEKLNGTELFKLLKHVEFYNNERFADNFVEGGYLNELDLKSRGNRYDLSKRGARDSKNARIRGHFDAGSQQQNALLALPPGSSLNNSSTSSSASSSSAAGGRAGAGQSSGQQQGATNKPVHGMRRKHWDLVILDEGHKLKNYSTGGHQQVKQIWSRQSILLSGTPLQNHLMELHSLFSLVVSKNVLGTQKGFKRRFQDPIKDGNHLCATDREVAVKTKMGQKLKRHILPYFLRRKKDSILQLNADQPQNQLGALEDTNRGSSNQRGASADQQETALVLANEAQQGAAAQVAGAQVRAASSSSASSPFLTAKKHVVCMFIKMKEETPQYRTYKKFIDSRAVNDCLKIADDNKFRNRAFQLIGELRKICNHPVLNLPQEEQMWTRGDAPLDFEEDEDGSVPLDQSQEGLMEAGAKVKLIRTLCNRWRREGRRFLIFSESKKFLDLLDYCVFGPGHFRTKRVDGDKTLQERTETLKQFDEAKAKARAGARNTLQGLLLTTKVGGVGLTLTAATRVILVDPGWNPSIEQQAEDRCYRIGQDEDVICYRLYLRNTIEEHMFCLQTFKTGLQRIAFEQEQQERHIAKDDLRKCFNMEPRDRPAHTLMGLSAYSEIRSGRRLKCRDPSSLFQSTAFEALHPDQVSEASEGSADEGEAQ